MSDENAILQYYQAIMNGSVVVGEWIKKLYDVIMDGLESKRWFFNPRKANNCTRFIETYCHHNKGPMAPGRLKLSLWERASLSLIFGIVDDKDLRQFTECIMVVGRKQGKTSVFGAGIGNYVAYAAGEFGSEIYYLAPKLDQADLCFGAFQFNVDHEPDLSRRTRSTKSRGLYIAETNTTIKKLPFSDRKSEGYNPMLYVGDEVASWPGQRGLRQWEAMASGTGAREEPLGIAISSAGYENEGIFDELVRRGTAFLNGNGREEHILPILYMIDDLSKWNDLNELQKSLPGLGESVSVKFILKEIAIAEGSLSKKTEFITKYCNRKQNASTAGLSAETVQKAFGWTYRLEDFRNCYALGGIDLSQTTDLTSACNHNFHNLYFIKIIFNNKVKDVIALQQTLKNNPSAIYAGYGCIVAGIFQPVSDCCLVRTLFQFLIFTVSFDHSVEALPLECKQIYPCGHPVQYPSCQNSHCGFSAADAGRVSGRSAIPVFFKCKCPGEIVLKHQQVVAIVQEKLVRR